MPSLLELVTSLLGDGDTLDKLGELIGDDAEQAKSASALATPAILGGLASGTESDQGLDMVMGMLDSARSVLDDVDGFVERGEAELGNTILDGLFGGDRADLVSGLAARADVGGPTMGKLMPMLAPIVATVVSNERVVGELEPGGVASMLAEEKATLDSEGIPHTVADFPAIRSDVGAGAAVGGAGLVGAAAAVASKGREAVAGAADKIGDGAEAVADKSEDALEAVVGKAGDTAGQAEDAVEAVAEKAEDVADAVSDKVEAVVEAVGDKAEDAVEAVSDKVEDATAAVTSGVKGIVGGDSGDGGRSGLGWLWWAVGAVALVLALAWLLSQCNDDSDDIDAGATTEVAVRDDESDRASGESGSGEAGDGDSQADSGAGSDAGGSQGGRSELQIEVDEALSGTGVTGVASDGVVTLTGTVEDAESASDAEGLVASLAGVESVDNEIEVDGSEDDGGEQEAETGDTINELLDLDPVTFRVNSATITDAGKAVLDDAAGFMLANPDISVEIGGHTDNDGSQSDNLDLSQRRADSVEAYLIGRGVEGDRLEAKGYGETQPKVPNDTAAAKAENRRIEFTIL